MKHALIAIGIAMFLVGGVVGVGGAWWYRQSEVDSAWNSGYNTGVDVAGVTVRTPASLTCGLNTTSLDHSSTVAAAGGVTTTTALVRTLWVNNTGETTATGLRLLLKNPVTDKEGLDNELETSDLDIYVTTSSGVNARLYREGAYTSGVEIPDLGAEDTVSFTIYFEMETATDGTFVDGQTYDCELYISQGTTSGTTYTAYYADVVDFTWST